MGRRIWREYELQYLREHWPAMNDAEIGKRLNRSATAIRNTRYKNGIRIDPADWSADEDAYICEHWRDQNDAEIAKELHRLPNEVYERGLSMGLYRGRHPVMGKRAWTKEEDEYLSEKWGTVPIKSMAKALRRTENSIINRKARLGLGCFLEAGDYITFNQFTLAFCGSNAGNAYKIKSWVKNRGFPMKTKIVNSMRVKVVYLDQFWKWAEENRSFLDFSRMEPLALGEEPDWVQEQRRKDFYAFANQRKDPWTERDDARLKMLVKEHRYGYAELSRMLQRSAGAIRRRCADLGLKERPVRVSPHEGHWTDEHYQILADGIRNGDSYTLIGEQIGKSEKAVRGKVYTVYFTESADKIRKMMGAGPWGSGAPEPTMRQAVHLPGHRQTAKDLATELVSLLTYRLQTMDGDNPYWQRKMCMHWDDVRCLKGCDNCDECSQFQRITPQYCARCGATFYERREQRFCQACRTARKKQAQRRWARQKAGG